MRSTSCTKGSKSFVSNASFLMSYTSEESLETTLKVDDEEEEFQRKHHPLIFSHLFHSLREKLHWTAPLLWGLKFLLIWGQCTVAPGLKLFSWWSAKNDFSTLNKMNNFAIVRRDLNSVLQKFREIVKESRISYF